MIRPGTRQERHPQPAALFAVVLVLLVALEACSARTSVPKTATTSTSPDNTQAPQPTVATDASFPEALGRRLPGAPDFPAYPGASLVGSAERNRPNDVKQGYRIEWTTRDSVPMVIAWYQKTLRDLGWTYTPPTDGVPNSQIADISKGDLDGTLEAEMEKGVTRIVVTLGPKK